MHGKNACLDTGMFGCCLDVTLAKNTDLYICLPRALPICIHKQTARLFVQDTE